MKEPEQQQKTGTLLFADRNLTEKPPRKHEAVA